MQRYLRSIAVFLLAVSVAAPAWAQTDEESFALEASPLTPVISGPRDIAIGRTLVLDASATKGLGEDTTYRWFRDQIPQPISRSIEAVYTPERSGETVFRLLVRTRIGGTFVEVEAVRSVIIYERKIVLIADASVPQEKIDRYRRDAVDAGVHLRVLQPFGSTISLTPEEALFQTIREESDAALGAEAIVMWTEGITGLQALMSAVEAHPERWEGLGNQPIVLITSGGLSTVSRTARGPYSLLKPQRIFVTRQAAFGSLLSSRTMEEFVEEMEAGGIDYSIVDASTVAVRPWNLLTALVNFMLTHGVSSQIVTLLLLLPIIAMIITFFKQVVGITTFGLYTPSVVALSFLALGWRIGLLFLIFIICTGYATRMFMRRWRLLYIPKVAIIMTVVSITLLILIAIGASLGITLSRDTVFILLIMSTLSESFLNLKTEEGLLSAFFGMGETILVALLCVFAVQWALLQSLVLAYPEIILLTVIVNVLLGRWTGLRLVEYFRFHEVFKHMEE